MKLGFLLLAMEPSPTEECYREIVFSKMEELVREMQHPETGVPVRSQKMFLTSIPCAFMGYDLVEWLMDHLSIEDSVEAVHLSILLCQHGYFFPVNDSKALTLKDDSTLYRFQTPYFWPSHHQPDNTDYAIYLTKRSQKNKQKHALEEYEQEALARLKKLLCHKWEFIQMQAEEQANLARDMKKTDKVVLDSQERAYWRVHRPPPGCSSCLERRPYANKRPIVKKSVEDLKKEVEFLQQCLVHRRLKASQAVDSLIHYCEEYAEFDPFLTGVLPSNPWITDDTMLWALNKGLVEIPTEKRVRRWALSLEELLSDPTGAYEFELYLQKEYSHENIRFWQAVQELRKGSQQNIEKKVKEIYNDFLVSGAPCEVNLDSKTVEETGESLKEPSRYTFDAAQKQVFALMEKDTYPRFLRSEHYRNLLLNALQPSQKKKLFHFGSCKKRVSPTGGSKKVSNTGALSGSTVDLSAAIKPFDLVERPFSGRHSHSTSDLHDLEAPTEKLMSSRLSSPAGSRDRMNETAPATLQVPKWSPPGESDLGEGEGPYLSLPVPSRNLVAPWDNKP